MQKDCDPAAFSCLSQNCYKSFNGYQEKEISLQNMQCSCCFLHVTMESSTGSRVPSVLVTGYENCTKVCLYGRNLPRQLHTATPVQETDPTATGVMVVSQTEVQVYR